MNNYYTYAYLREDGTPYYIGKGRNKRAFIKGNHKVSLPPEKRILLLKQNLTEIEAFRHEIYMIAVFGRKDLKTGILLNMTDGGEGASLGMKHAEKTKKKIGIGNKGKIHSDEQNKRHSEMMKGKTAWNKGVKKAGYRQGIKKCVYRGMEFPSMTDAAEYFGVTVSAVSLASKKHVLKG